MAECAGCCNGVVTDELSVGEVAKRSGLAVSAIHFYEAKGLIKSRRGPGNHRRYPRWVLRRIAVIKVAQKTGMSLEQIQEALKVLPDECAPTRDDWRRMAEEWKRVRGKVDGGRETEALR